MLGVPEMQLSRRWLYLRLFCSTQRSTSPALRSPPLTSTPCRMTPKACPAPSPAFTTASLSQSSALMFYSMSELERSLDWTG